MQSNWRIPILTYHGLHAPGWDYNENDHVALEQDLKLLASTGFKVASLDEVVNLLLLESMASPKTGRLVALTFDDGTDLDYEDFYHPDYGYLKSFRSLLLEASGLGVDGGIPPATSFVIGSPDARTELDGVCIAGRGQWSDNWWRDSAREGPLAIANHSWDHTHPELANICIDASHRGRFDLISDFETGDAEILRAERYIRERTDGASQPFFAYPYGHYNDFLVEEYFPARMQWFRAAFTTAGRPAEASDSRWRIPRFVCGDHWKSPDELIQILNAI